MRRCPLCGVPLDRVRYEGFPIHKCSGCNGVLLESARIRQIQRKLENEPQEIATEAKTERAADTPHEIRCPRCHCPMEKERAFADDMPLHKAGMASFGVDVCGQCGITWLDGGELALVQLNYEFSPKGVESRRHYVNYDKLDAAGKDEFIRAIADSVPDVASSYAAAFADAVSQAARRYPTTRR